MAAATFFLQGEWAEANPEFVRQAEREGHEIANHSFSHPAFTEIGAREMRRQIVNTQQVLQGTYSKPIRHFRPLYGEYDGTVADLLRELNYDLKVTGQY